MKNGVRLHTTFCEDFRQEVGNKVSVIGVYQDELSAPRASVVLPKLVVWVQGRSPLEIISPVTIKVMLDEELLGEMKVDLANPEPASKADRAKELGHRTFNTVLQFIPFVVEQGQKDLSVIAELEGDSELIGKLLLRVAETPTSAPLSSN
jgi:hypothetical protein